MKVQQRTGFACAKSVTGSDCPFGPTPPFDGVTVTQGAMGQLMTHSEPGWFVLPRVLLNPPLYVLTDQLSQVTFKILPIQRDNCPRSQLHELLVRWFPRRHGRILSRDWRDIYEIIYGWTFTYRLVYLGVGCSTICSGHHHCRSGEGCDFSFEYENDHWRKRRF
jgi:hypothetical protein